MGPFSQKNLRPIRVIVVDDSIVVRRLLKEVLDRDPQIEVVDTARDPYDAEGKILHHKPDVLTLDIEMPRMDGITFLRILMEKRPMPVIVLSSLSTTGSSYAMQALQAGAVDVLAKPHGPYSVGDAGIQLTEKIKAAARACLRNTRPGFPARNPQPTTRALVPPAVSKTAIAINTPPSRNPLGTRSYPPPSPNLPNRNRRFHSRSVILLGASTGGTEALREVITHLPPDVPGIGIVQHIPPHFSKAFAERLHQLSQLEVKEAEDGDILAPGKALVAPGDFHLVFSWQGGHYRASLRKGPMVWHQRPAVDLMFRSAAPLAREFATAALLTGMGKDGAEGLLELRMAGAVTFAQNEDTCVVFGMPKAAVELNAACQTLPLTQIAPAINKTIERHLLA